MGQYNHIKEQIYRRARWQ